jgi:STE24 endopeptidase
VDLSSVHEWHESDDAEASALVTGAGHTRRVLIASPVLRDWTDDEIAVIVAHELAHHRHHDLHVTLAMDACVVALAAWTADVVLARISSLLGVTGPGDLAALPALMLVAGLVWVAATPVRHAVSRWQERRADRFALNLADGVEAFSAAVRRLGAQHLAEDRPSLVARWFFGRHPPVAERLALADAHHRGRLS